MKKKSSTSKSSIRKRNNNKEVEGMIEATRKALDLISSLQETVLKLNADNMWLIDMVAALKKENESIKSDEKETRNIVNSILNKLNLEVKKVVKDKQEKNSPLHDDHTERCSKCNSIISKKEKSCHHCGFIKK